MKGSVRAVMMAAIAPISFAMLSSAAFAQDLFDSGRLLATGGVSQVEGAGGGGLSAWALITGYGSRDGVGANAHVTYIPLSDFSLLSEGVAVALFDRLELSYAHQTFDTENAGARLGLGKGFKFDQDIVGAKVRLFGDAVFDQDSWVPQVSAGLQYKMNDRGDVIRAIGGRHDSGTDYYLAASKLFLAERLLVNATIRATEANQYGLLGFGGDKGGYSAQFEGGAAFLLTRSVALGFDYRTKPDNLKFAEEDDSFDIFAAWFINKNLSVTLAYADLGDIALQGRQDGAYLSLQVGF